MSYKPKVLAVSEGGTGITSVGTSGNALTSNGSIWISSAFSPILLSVSGTLTNAQIKALNATPVQIIAAPGSGKMILIVNAILDFKYGGSNVFVAAAAQTVTLYYSTTTSSGIVLANAVIVGTTSKFQLSATQTIAQVASTSYDNLALNLYNSVATEISGNAANDNVIDYTVYYYIVTL